MITNKILMILSNPALCIYSLIYKPMQLEGGFDLVYKGDTSIYQRNTTDPQQLVNIYVVPIAQASFKQGSLSISYWINHLEEKFEKQTKLDTELYVRNYRCYYNVYNFTAVQENYTKNLHLLILEKKEYSHYLNIMNSLIQVLKYNKEKKIILRDLRPDNIAIFPHKKTFKAKIISINNCVNFNHRPKKHIEPLLSTSYTAPQVLFDRSYNEKADVWSFGCIFYNILFGNVKGILVSNNRVKVNFPEGTPSWMIDILEKMLDFNIQQRYSIEDVENRFKALNECVDICNKIFPINS